MERVEGAQTPYEVYCFDCRVTFPVGTRRCLHCGSPLYAPGETAKHDPDMPRQPPIPSEGELAEHPLGVLRNHTGLVLWAFIALAGVLNSLCRG
jgi:hypothetical protein